MNIVLAVQARSVTESFARNNILLSTEIWEECSEKATGLSAPVLMGTVLHVHTLWKFALR